MMTFDQAANFRLPFGKHKSVSLSELAEADSGLLYLDWLAGQSLYGALRQALDTYLGDPSIAREVNQALEKTP